MAVNTLRFREGLLDASGIEYALIRGHAVDPPLEPHSTADLELTIEVGVERVDRQAEVLLETGFEQDSPEGADRSSGPDFARFTSSTPQLVLDIQAARTALFQDDTELFKQFSNNESFRAWKRDTVFDLTYPQETHE